MNGRQIKILCSDAYFIKIYFQSLRIRGKQLLQSPMMIDILKLQTKYCA